MIETITYQDSNGNKPYADWLGSLTDKQAKARILVRVTTGRCWCCNRRLTI